MFYTRIIILLHLCTLPLHITHFILLKCPFWVNQAGLPPAVLGPNILSKGVETSPTATQFGSACVQTMSRLPGARLRRAGLFQMSRGR